MIFEMIHQKKYGCILIGLAALVLFSTFGLAEEPPTGRTIEIQQVGVSELQGGMLTIVVQIAQIAAKGEQIAVGIGPLQTFCDAECSPVNDGLWFTYLDHPDVRQWKTLNVGITEFTWKIAVQGKGRTQFVATVVACGEKDPLCKTTHVLGNAKESGVLFIR